MAAAIDTSSPYNHQVLKQLMALDLVHPDHTAELRGQPPYSKKGDKWWTRYKVDSLLKAETRGKTISPRNQVWLLDRCDSSEQIFHLLAWNKLTDPKLIFIAYEKMQATLENGLDDDVANALLLSALQIAGYGEHRDTDEYRRLVNEIIKPAVDQFGYELFLRHYFGSINPQIRIFNEGQLDLGKIELILQLPAFSSGNENGYFASDIYNYGSDDFEVELFHDHPKLFLIITEIPPIFSEACEDTIPCIFDLLEESEHITDELITWAIDGLARRGITHSLILSDHISDTGSPERVAFYNLAIASSISKRLQEMELATTAHGSKVVDFLREIVRYNEWLFEKKELLDDFPTVDIKEWIIWGRRHGLSIAEEIDSVGMMFLTIDDLIGGEIEPHAVVYEIRHRIEMLGSIMPEADNRNGGQILVDAIIKENLDLLSAFSKAVNEGRISKTPDVQALLEVITNSGILVAANGIEVGSFVAEADMQKALTSFTAYR